MDFWNISGSDIKISVYVKSPYEVIYLFKIVIMGHLEYSTEQSKDILSIFFFITL